MSFSLDVFAGSVPEDLLARWIASLADNGLAVEARPGFVPGSWRGGWVSFKVTFRKGDSPGLARYPERPLVAGFELDVGANEDGASLAEDAPASVRGVVRNAPTVFSLSTPSGRTVADLRLQCWAAAGLAIATGGVVYDPQQDAFFIGTAASQNAVREIEEYEADATDPASWNLEAFEGW